MEKCNIDHFHCDIIRKLESQQAFLPKLIVEEMHSFLKNTQSQQTLNELFHLLKKYDLVSKEEQEEKNQRLIQLISDQLI
ncbi:group-specific protein [Paenibacillus sp. SYP-B3998]|uniref:Group-specific protein n=1 Tax=Paenibacillus sp. SYP-B3998 TaxID=2678564 RepID=A0A6G3ZUK9_9BACL|nr:group-specific protein [Paenibacillus sp. SYP-B3998]NEW05906.1 group-specific protein [Paenibacillus sp. SYP-B3998]